jgi:glycosyltransferase involved in cell wall biosynthesis
MKVVFIGTFTPETNYTRDLSVYFQKILQKGDTLYLCGTKGEDVKDAYSPKVKPVWKKNWRYIFDIVQYVQEVKPDVIHLQHEFKMFGGFATALTYPFLLATLRILGYPLVVTVHGVVAQKQVNREFLESFNVKPNALMKYVVIAFFSYVYISIIFLANKVTVHAPPLKKVLEGYSFMASKKVVVIDHGIREIHNLDSKQSSHIDKKFPMIKGKNLILIFGLFSPRKGYEYLIRTYDKVLREKHLNNWVLGLVGDVKDEFLPYKEKIVDLIQELGLEKKVLITGYIDGVEIDEFYRNAKIVVIPAIISFNTSGALSLSLAYKKPLITANVKPLADEVSSNNFGLLYDQTGPRSLEKQLGKLMSDKKLYNSLIKKLETSVTKRYWTKIAKEHYDLYKEVM